MAIFMAVLAIIQADPEPRSHYGYRSRYGQVRGYSGRFQGRNNRGYGKIQPYGSSYKGYGKKRPSVLPMAHMAMPMAPPSPKVRINYWIYPKKIHSKGWLVITKLRPTFTFLRDFAK